MSAPMSTCSAGFNASSEVSIPAREQSSIEELIVLLIEYSLAGASASLPLSASLAAVAEAAESYQKQLVTVDALNDRRISIGPSRAIDTATVESDINGASSARIRLIIMARTGG